MSAGGRGPLHAMAERLLKRAAAERLEAARRPDGAARSFHLGKAIGYGDALAELEHILETLETLRREGM